MASAPPVSGPPYPPTAAGLGGSPVPGVDDPVCAVLLVFFIAAAATNMTILQVNMRRGHKFIISGMTFGFCMARTTALVIRIVWASRPHNISVAIASNVLTVAGVVLLFLINLIFAQRIVRAHRPRLGWSRPVTYAFRALFYSVLVVLVMVIPVAIDTFYTLDPSTRGVLRRVQLVGTVYMAVLSFLPIPITLLTLFAPPRPPYHGAVENFGQGHMRTKIALLLFTSTLLCLGASFRAAVNFMPRPLSDPAWFDSKPAYYVFNFGVELIVVYTYTIVRFDRRFFVPNGSSAPGHYAAGGAVADTSVGAAAGDAADSAERGETAEVNNGGSPVLARKPTLADRTNYGNDVFGSDEEPTLGSINGNEGKPEH
ncbi:hypothetical protein SPBR_02914 [Sporothrix brasiliensis 5110]|uniref:Family c-likeg-protein-coupled receptor protein n=1 Tax=Sporothrix brasiliensis 5110 TaxID=1398154 RepID=A0A0C2FPN5_9PEZI|nr:uncharacterized protein SPBR_02914 [Sporothrix brasiliensis 5110]KIH93023.1 hypothetical protein SPBR_02914 [Sporothrix brasiliensis 5110]